MRREWYQLGDSGGGGRILDEVEVEIVEHVHVEEVFVDSVVVRGLERRAARLMGQKRDTQYAISTRDTLRASSRH